MWNVSTPKCSVFWDASRVLQKLPLQPLNWQSVEAVCNRLIVVCRILQLFHSVDLAQTWRSCSVAGDEMFIVTKRKGFVKPNWEPLIEGLDPALCPASLVGHYVCMTSSHCVAGSPFLRSLRPPYPPSRPIPSGVAPRNCWANWVSL